MWIEQTWIAQKQEVFSIKSNVALTLPFPIEIYWRRTCFQLVVPQTFGRNNLYIEPLDSRAHHYHFEKYHQYFKWFYVCSDRDELIGAELSK